MFQQEGYDFMAAAFEVYNEIGYGMAEEVYQQSLEIELSLRKIPFLTKQQLAVYYKGHTLSTSYKPDLLVYGGIVVELKPSRNCCRSTKPSYLTTCACPGWRWATSSTSARKAAFNGTDSS